jgi:hypothetical protein
MFKHIYEIVGKEISGENAKNIATGVTQFHRIQVSPHFREAAHWCQNQLELYGLSCKIHEYTADGKTPYWSFTLPKEWKIESATLEIDGDVWADFRDTKVSVIQRSHPADVEAEIVHIETDDEDAFKNVKGKIIHSPLPLEKIKDLALHYKAAGIITSGIREITMRTRLDVPDAVHYYSFWGEKGSGFILSPRKGEKLKKLIKKREKDDEKGPVKAKMVIQSELYPGTMEVVDAFIPGETDEEVVVVAHLCHPQPSANDNASGCGALIEVARALNTLIRKNSLKKPKRGIRFLLVPEIHGTVVYLASHPEKMDHLIAGINLDMVGENQDLCKSSFLLERTPDSMPSFINDLAEIIFEELTRELGNLSDTTTYASFRHAITPFSGGSDHYILSDPTVGVPCPMVIQWPDLFYHSSLDTPEKLDPASLKKASVLTATYAYFIAIAGEKEAEWLALMMGEKAKERLSRKVREILTDTNGKESKKEKEINYHGLLDYLLDRELDALHSLKKLADIDTTPLVEELDQFVFTERKKIPLQKEKKEEECTWVPKRKFPGPISTRNILLGMSFEERKAYEKKQEEYKADRLMGNVAVYWADGERTLSEINRLLTYEVGKGSLEFLKWYFAFLAEHDLIELVKR